MLETERLILRSFSLEDAPFVFELVNSEGWLRHIGKRDVRSIPEAEKYIRNNYLSTDPNGGIGPFVVCLKTCRKAIGTVGLYKRTGLDCPDIGYAFLPAFWHQGFAYEAARAVIEIAQKGKQICMIAGITRTANDPSIRLLKKLGLKQSGFFTSENGEKLLLFKNDFAKGNKGNMPI